MRARQFRRRQVSALVADFYQARDTEVFVAGVLGLGDAIGAAHMESPGCSVKVTASYSEPETNRAGCRRAR
jgi:hypothetical protein